MKRFIFSVCRFIKCILEKANRVWKFVTFKMAFLKRKWKDICLTIRNWKDLEIKELIEKAASFDDKVPHWLSSSTNPSVIRIVARSAFVVPGFCTGTGHQLRLPDDVCDTLSLSKFRHACEEDPLPLISNSTDLAEDIYYFLYLNFMLRDTNTHRNEGLTIKESVQESLKTINPELFGAIVVNLTENWYQKETELLLRGFNDGNFKLREIIWFYLLDRVSIPNDKTHGNEKALISRIIGSNRFDFFKWTRSKSLQVEHSTAINLTAAEA